MAIGQSPRGTALQSTEFQRGFSRYGDSRGNVFAPGSLAPLLLGVACWTAAFWFLVALWATPIVAGRVVEPSASSLRYPLGIDSLSHPDVTLTGTDVQGFSRFGSSVAVSADGSTALIGGLPDVNALEPGAVWVFVRSNGAWRQEGVPLVPNDPAGASEFGESVALSADGDTALIGGPADNAPAGGPEFEGVGAAWVFVRTGVGWTQQGAKLTPDDEQGAAEFGQSVSLSRDGDVALVGGPTDKDQVGAAWEFASSGSTWRQQATLFPAESFGIQGFGSSVALSADARTAIVGSADTLHPGFGAVWTFIRSGAAWTRQGARLNTRTVDHCCFDSVPVVALSASGTTALVGSATNAAAWVFARSGPVWRQQGPMLVARDPVPGMFGSDFGGSVALAAAGTEALIGGDDDNSGAGGVWSFADSGGTWIQIGPKRTASRTTERGNLGASVALSASGRTGLAGDPNTGTTGTAIVFSNPLADNHFKVATLRITANGVIRVAVAVPGPGVVNVLETAWNDNLATAASLLRPAVGRFVFSRGHVVAKRATTAHISLAPDRRGRLLVTRRRYPVTLRLWVSYTPSEGVQRSMGLYGIHLPAPSNLQRQPTR